MSDKTFNARKLAKNQSRSRQNQDDGRNKSQEMFDRHQREVENPLSPTNTLTTFESWDLI